MDTREPSSSTACAATASPSAVRSARTAPSGNGAPAGSTICKGEAGNSSSAGRWGATRTRGSGPKRFASRTRSSPSRSGGQIDPHRQIARRIGEQDLDRRGDARNGGGPGLHGHHVARHCMGPSRRGRTKPRVGDQPGELGTLQRLVPRLRFAAFGEAPLVPGEGAALRRQQPAPHLHPVAELGVLPTIALEGLVETAERLEEGPQDAQIVPGHGPEEILVTGGQAPGPGHVPLPPGRIERPAREQFPERAGAPENRPGIDARHRHISAEPERHGVGDRVVPARMGRQQPGLGDHVAVGETPGWGAPPRAPPALRARASPNPRRCWRTSFTSSGVDAGRRNGGSEPSSTITTSNSSRG